MLYICYWLNVKILKIAISICCDYTWQDMLGWSAIRHETQSLLKLFLKCSTVQTANNPLKTALALSQILKEYESGFWHDTHETVTKFSQPGVCSLEDEKKMIISYWLTRSYTRSCIKASHCNYVHFCHLQAVMSDFNSCVIRSTVDLAFCLNLQRKDQC